MKLMKQKIYKYLFFVCEYIGPTSFLYISILLSHTHSHTHTTHTHTHTHTGSWVLPLEARYMANAF